MQEANPNHTQSQSRFSLDRYEQAVTTDNCAEEKGEAGFGRKGRLKITYTTPSLKGTTSASRLR